MLRKLHSKKSGFTLVELAIVVGIAGLLFSGLWRLMSSGNAQLREQAAADQVNQLVNATRGWLASAEGQGFVTAMDATVAASQVRQITLPTVANPAGSAGCAAAMNLATPNTGTYCTFLPAGFTAATVNSYNQIYRVYVRKLDGVAGAPAQSYEFLITSNNGDVISDNSGGRMSANIGANGGFIYNANVCGAPIASTACGAFGGFTFNLLANAPTGFGPVLAASPGSGHLAILTGNAASNFTNANWLARVTVAGDNPAWPGNVFNTMTVDLNMGNNGILPANIQMQRTAPFPGGAVGAINMRGGLLNMYDGTNTAGQIGSTLNLESATIQGPGIITITNNDGSIPLTLNTSAAAPTATAAQITGQNCDITLVPCSPALNVSGSLNFSDGLSGFNGNFSGTLSAATFIYVSDMRAKKNIEPLTGSLDKIAQLQGHKFRWRSDDKEDIGLIAQEVQKVYPELVHHNGSTDRLGVEYGNLIAPMIEAIKELRAQNEAQQREIDALRRSLKAH